MGKKHFCFFQTEPNSGVKGSGDNHYPRASAPQITSLTGLPIQLTNTLPVIHIWARILVQVTIYRRLLIGRDSHLDQLEAYDIS